MKKKREKEKQKAQKPAEKKEMKKRIMNKHLILETVGETDMKMKSNSKNCRKAYKIA